MAHLFKLRYERRLLASHLFKPAYRRVLLYAQRFKPTNPLVCSFKLLANHANVGLEGLADATFARDLDIQCAQTFQLNQLVLQASLLESRERWAVFDEAILGIRAHCCDLLLDGYRSGATSSADDFTAFAWGL